MKADLQLRPFQPADFATVCELDKLCFPPGIAYPPEEVAYFLSERGAICHVAIVGENIVGWILGHARKVTGHVVTIDVHPDWRRRGVGLALLDELEKDFRGRGCKKVRLEVATNNPDALAFYARLGFRSLKILPRYYADDSDAYLMKRTLGGLS